MFNFKFLVKNKKHRFLDEYDMIIADIISGKRLSPRGDLYSRKSINNFKTARTRIESFEKEVGTIYVEEIKQDLKLIDSFRSFLIEKGYAKNTISMTMARVKSAMRILYHKGIASFPGSGISCSGELTTAVFNQLDEIKMLLDMDITETTGLERVRDIYVMQCFVGLRYGDFAMILDDPKKYIKIIDSNQFFEIKTFKTGEVVVIPIARIVNEILEKYNYDFGEPFSYQYYNLSIKLVAERCGINQDTVFSRTEGGLRVDSVVKKFELMSSHTARRTFATNAYLSGLSERTIMAITGHKTTQAFYRYIRCSSMEAAIKIAGHAFFNIDFRTNKLISYIDLTNEGIGNTMALPKSEED